MTFDLSRDYDRRALCMVESIVSIAVIIGHSRKWVDLNAKSGVCRHATHQGRSYLRETTLNRYLAQPLRWRQIFDGIVLASAR
jgi:hypothetical protein